MSYSGLSQLTGTRVTYRQAIIGFIYTFDSFEFESDVNRLYELAAPIGVTVGNVIKDFDEQNHGNSCPPSQAEAAQVTTSTNLVISESRGKSAY